MTRKSNTEKKTDSMLWRLANRVNTTHRLIGYIALIYLMGLATGYVIGDSIATIP